MKRDIDLFLGKVSKIIKGKNFLYCVCKKGYSFEFIVAAKRLQSQKQDSLIFVRHENRFIFCNDFVGSKFKGLLIYGSLAKTIKNELAIYTYPELKKEIYNKHDAFALGLDSVAIKSILDFCYQIYKYSMEAQNLYKSDLLNIRLFLQTYLMENAKTERLKKLIKKYEEYKK